MKNIHVKTDASFKRDVGYSVAYHCEVVHNGHLKYDFSDSKFFDRNIKSTDAEVMAVGYAIIQTFKNMGGRVSDYRIIIETDSKHAVNVYEDMEINKKLKDVIQTLLDKFIDWNIRWISRDLNMKADGLAKIEIRRAEDELG